MTSERAGFDRRIRRLTRVAYMEALAGRDLEAVQAVHDIYDAGGTTGLQTALLIWTDTFIDHSVNGRDYRLVVSEDSFVSSETGETLDAAVSGPVSAEYRWVAQLISARAALDRARWNELLAAVPEGKAGRYVFAVLQALAATVSRLPRGYALMGS